MRKKIIVITGGPGFGKSSLLDGLAILELKLGEEAARGIIAEQIRLNGDVLPWMNVGAFQDAVLKRRIEFWESVGDNEIAFSDRAIPDQLAFARFRGFVPSGSLKEAAENYRYYDEVLVCPPWAEIYVQDEIRTETFSDACRLHELICKVYLKLGYKLVELPIASIEERIRFITDLFSIRR